MAQILDYSAGFPGALAIARAGYGGAVRYIGFPNRRKCTNRAELEDFSRHGLGMALVFQDAKGDWRGGFDAGQLNARRARDHADAIGFPSSRPIYMAIDDDVVTEAEFRQVVEYIRGAAAELGGPEFTGPYGEFDVMVRVAQAGVGRWFWQCRAWSGTPIRFFRDRHLFQLVGTVRVGGIDCDINDIRQGVADWGQHNAQQEEDMPLTRADLDAMREMIKFEVLAAGDFRFGGRNVIDMLVQTTGSVLDIQGKEDAQTAMLHALTDDEVTIVAAVRAAIAEIPAGGQVDVQALAPVLIAAINQLGTLVARAPDDQVEQLLAAIGEIPTDVRHVLAAALAGGSNV